MSTDLLASKSPTIIKYNTPTDKQLSEVTNVRYVSCLVGAEVGGVELAPLEAPGGLRVVEPPALRARGRQRGGDLGVGDEAALQPQGLAAPDLGAAGHPCMQSSALTKYIINRERCK